MQRDPVRRRDELFHITRPQEIACLFTSFVGPVETLLEELRKRTRMAKTQILSEPKAGLLVGSLRSKGFLAIAGTGSDVFYVTDRRNTVGGYGPILSDGGAW